MIRLFPKLFRYAFQKVQITTFQYPISVYKFSSSNGNNNNYNNNNNNNKSEQEVFYEDILKEHEFNKKVLEIEKMDASEQIYFIDTIVKKYDSDANWIVDYGNIIINSFLTKEDYTNALKCSDIVINYLKNKVSPSSLKLFQFYSMKCECSIKLNDKHKALTYIAEAEECFNANISTLMSESIEYFTLADMLALRFSDLGLYEKCVYYASLCLSIDNIQIQQKVIPTLILLDSLTTLHKDEEALQFGMHLLSQISFQEIGMIFNEVELEMIKVIYERVASLLIAQNDISKAYLYQDVLLYLIQITESEDSYKYEAVYNWRQENLYQIALKEKGEMYEILHESEIQKQRKLGIMTDEIQKQISERANKLAKQISVQYQIILQLIDIHKNVYLIAEKRFQVENTFPSDTQSSLLGLVSKSIELEEKVLNVPIIDQYFVKNEYYKIKNKLSKEIQDKIEKQLSKKK